MSILESDNTDPSLACYIEMLALGVDEEEAALLAWENTEPLRHQITDLSSLLKALDDIHNGSTTIAARSIESFLELVFESHDYLLGMFCRGNRNEIPDFSIVSIFYEKIFSLETEDLWYTIALGLRQIGSNLVSDSSSLDVSVWLICLLCPYFSCDFGSHLRQDYFKAWEEFTLEQRCYLKSIICSFTAKEMQHLLNVAHYYLLEEGPFHSTNIDEIEKALLFINLLYETNTISNVMSYQAFYNESLNCFWLDNPVTAESDFRWVFENYPFLFNNQIKSKSLQRVYKCQQQDATRRAYDQVYRHSGTRKWKLHRQRVLEDAFNRIEHLRERSLVHYPISVQFVGEQGIDGGGLTKEFFKIVMEKLFKEDYGMFQYDQDLHYWWFRPSSVLVLNEEFDNLGVLIGLALFNGHLLNLQFPLVFYKKLLGQNVDLRDLKDVFPDVYRNLNQLLDMESDVSSLELYFTIDEDSGFGATEEIPLKPGGNRIKVTDVNKYEYTRLYANFLLVERVKAVFDPLKDGFMSVCGNPYLQYFQPEQLEEVICGTKVTDFEDLKSSIVYNRCRERDQIIRWLWQILFQYDEEKKKKFVRFVTGSDRAPIGGFQCLQPKFTITCNSLPLHQLPTAYTCFNSFGLPQYTSLSMLRSRMDTALEHSEGFGFA